MAEKKFSWFLTFSGAGRHAMSAGSIFTKNRGDGGLRLDKLDYIITVRARTVIQAFLALFSL